MYKSPSRYPVGSGITVYLRHQTWWADIRRDGIRAQRNLRTHDQKEAVRHALDIGLGTTSIRAVRWQEAFDRYLAEHSPLYHAPQSKAKAVCILGEFARFMERGGPEGSLALDAVTRTRVEDWLRVLAPRLSPCTCNCKLRTLRAFLRWTVGKGWLPADPVGSKNSSGLTSPLPDLVVNLDPIKGYRESGWQWMSFRPYGMICSSLSRFFMPHLQPGHPILAIPLVQF